MKDDHAQPAHAGPIWGGSLAAILAALALACDLSALIGAAIGWPLLAGLGQTDYPVWPNGAIARMIIASGILFWGLGYRTAARVAWSISLTFAAIAVVNYFGGPDLLPLDFTQHGIDRGPGSGGPLAIINLVALSAAALIGSRRHRPRLPAYLMVAVPSGVALLAIMMILTGQADAPQSRWFSGSIPAAVATIFISASILSRWTDFAMLQLISLRSSEWRRMRLVIMAAVLAPIIPMTLEFLALGSHALSPLAVELTVVIGNSLLIGTLVYWGITRVARQEAELSELMQALDTSNIAITRADGTITHWSRGCEQLYGWRASEAVGRKKYELLHTFCEIGRGRTAHAASLEGVECVETCRDGGQVSVIQRAEEIQTPGREPVCALVMLDVTQRVQALRALRRSEERLILAAEAHEVGIFEWDVASGLMHWSPGAEQRLGLKTGDLRDFETWQSMVHPEDTQQVLNSIARAVAERADRYSFRYRLRHTAAPRSIEGSARCFYDEAGNLTRTVGVVLDMTERDEREAELRGREAQLRTVLETVPDAMVVLDQTGTILEFSAAAETLWGYKAHEVVGRNFTMLTVEDERMIYMHALEHFMNSGHNTFVGHTTPGTALAADGRIFPVEGRVGMARSDDRFLFTAFFRDLSDRLANEERLADLNEELMHVSRQGAMSELAADLAHELNQPLAATANFLAASRMLLERGDDKTRVSDLLQMANEQTIRAGEIIRRLRDFIARREIETRAEPLVQLVRDAVELVTVGTGRFDIRIDLELDHAKQMVIVDRVQIQQVLVNLLKNSIEALRESDATDRRIVISSRAMPPDSVEIWVADNGPGMPEKVLEQLFTRFSTTKGKGGMGIGLSISRRIIEAHGGALAAENRPAGGAMFRFTLPAMTEIEEEEQEAL